MSGDAYLRAEVATDLQRRLAGVHGVGHDEHRMVRAVVSGSGALVDLAFHPAAPALGATRLGEAIVAAAAAAQSDAAQRGYTAMALALGDEATATVVATAEASRFTETEPAGPPSWPATGPRSTPPAGDDADLDSFDASIFRSDR